MSRHLWTIALLALVATACTACGGGEHKDPVTASPNAGTGTGSTAGSGAGGPSRGGSADSGSGSGSGGGSEGASLALTHFRTLAVTVSPAAGGTVTDNFAANGSVVQDCTSCRERYREGTRVTLTADAAPGFTFQSWQGSVCDGSVSPTCSVRMDDNHQVTAVFSR